MGISLCFVRCHNYTNLTHIPHMHILMVKFSTVCSFQFRRERFAIPCQPNHLGWSVQPTHRSYCLPLQCTVMIIWATGFSMCFSQMRSYAVCSICLLLRFLPNIAEEWLSACMPTATFVSIASRGLDVRRSLFFSLSLSSKYKSGH